MTRTCKRAKKAGAPARGKSIFLFRRTIFSWGGLADRFHRDESGQIAFIGLFGAVALVFMLAMVLNAADNIQEKTRMQNAADTAALAAAHVIAGGLNTISDNNVAITELLAIWSISEGLYKTGSNPLIQMSYLFQYIIAEGVCQARVIPIASAAACIAKHIPRVAYNYCRQVTNQKSILMNTIPGLCRNEIRVLQAWNAEVALFMQPHASRDAQKIASMNGAYKAGMAYQLTGGVLPIVRGKGGMVDWNNPTRYGSPRGAKGEADRRGYFHVYQPTEKYPKYKLSKGPFPTFYEDAEAWIPYGILKKLPNPWDLPCLDPEAMMLKFESLRGLSEESMDSEEFQAEIMDEFKDTNLTLSSLMGSFSTITTANTGFRARANKQLNTNMSSMGALWKLSEFKKAYERLGFVTYAIAQPNRATIAMPAGKTGDFRPFAQSGSGFNWPNKAGTIAVAQCQVYNPVSWDLFTQYWDYRLTRVTKLPLFTGNMDKVVIQPLGIRGKTELYH